MHSKNLMLAAAFVAAFAAPPALASDADDAFAPVKQFVEGFNAGDVESALAACAPVAHIIDEFPPFQWSGEGACATWADDYAADVEKKGVTDAFVTLHAPKHVLVEGDHAYIVAPVEYSYMVGDQKEIQQDSTLTLALEKQGGAWKITQWAWSQGELRE